MSYEDEIKNWIKNNLYKKDSSINVIKIREYNFKLRYPNKLNEIILLTSFLDINVSISERIYCILNDIIEKKKCLECGCFVNFHSYTRGYNIYCSKDCKNKSKVVQDKMKKTCLERYGVDNVLKDKEKMKKSIMYKYGVENVFQSDFIKDKIKKTCLERYGVENISSNEDIKNKKKETMIKNFGVEYVLQNEDIKNKVKNTNLERYGVDNVFKNKTIREKIKKTMLKKYGVDNAFKDREKIKNIMIEKYGVEHSLQNEDIKNKVKNTNLERYGVENVFQSKNIKEKIKETILEKYNVENIFQSESIKKKIKNTMIEKYGVKHALQNKDIKNKEKNTNLERYGVDCIFKDKNYRDKIIKTNKKIYNVPNYSQSHWNKETLEKINNKEFLEKEYLLNKKSSRKIANEINVSQFCLLNKLHFFNIPIRYEIERSSYEQEIVDFINLPNILTNVRNIIPPYELDIYLPDYKLAIEFNGLYWHSTLKDNDYKAKFRNINKTKLCNNIGIKLFHIFENEWLNITKQDIWKSIVNKELGRNLTINSSDCDIKLLNNNEFMDFLYRNSLNNYINCDINYK